MTIIKKYLCLQKNSNCTIILRVKKTLGIIILSLLLGFNAYAKQGSGELKLSKEIMTEFLKYLYGSSNPKYSDGADKRNNPMLMTISKDGNYSHYYYCPYVQGCETGNYAFKSIKNCEKRSNGSPCFVFAKKRKIIWENGIKSKKRKISKKLLKEPHKIAKIVQDLGFYDNDISELPSINFKTAKITEDTTITGKKYNKDKKKITKKYELNGERSIAVSWQGYKDLIAGTVSFNEVNFKGTLNLPLPNNDGYCDGSYSLQQGGKGTWQITCTNNLGAAGTLKWSEGESITGSGLDHNDNKVKFIVSKKN